ncbi:molybdenum cofactor biosynthesis protein MoaE [Methanocorpusculum sp.]|nr:molybdenum cofactor biosynthesis protein MoaE [Methanocorpusculum sp.]MBO5367472.1 molybdenum cofactor biosynthesis protein MoaE [Methanocorpusculum sp.]
MTEILRLQEEDFDIGALLSKTRDKADGAQLVFVGCVRDDGLEALEIEAFVPVAETDLQRIADECREKFGVRAVHIIHRYGHLKVGENIVIIIVCSAHRGEGYEASRYAIERLKELVPVWKQEIVNGKKGNWVEVH